MKHSRVPHTLRIAVALLLALPGAADPSRAAGDEAPRPGLWVQPQRERPASDLSPEQRREIERLEAIGYLDGTEPATDQPPIRVHERDAIQPGLNFVVSGHAAEAALMDVDGRILHRWHHAFADIWPDREIPARHSYWRRARAFPNGDLLAIYEGWGIIKLDARSRVLWANPVRAHHDLEVRPDGRIFVLTRKAQVVPEIDPARPVLEDFITILDSEGQTLREVSILRAILDSPFRKEFDAAAGKKVGDVLHTNSLFVLDGRGSDRAPWLAAGNVLISMREPSLLAVVDLAQARVVAMWSGDFRFQHDAELLENGNLMLFDNAGLGRFSRVVESDPVTREVRWSYAGGPDRPFYSQYVGAAQRLPNGNTLITESGEGRGFEVRPDGTIVWEYNSPHRAGENGQLVASLLELVRLPVDFPTGWATPDAAPPSGP